MGQDIHVYLARKTSEYAQKNGCEKYYPVELYTKYDTTVLFRMSMQTLIVAAIMSCFLGSWTVMDAHM